MAKEIHTEDNHQVEDLLTETDTATKTKGVATFVGVIIAIIIGLVLLFFSIE